MRSLDEKRDLERIIHQQPKHTLVPLKQIKVLSQMRKTFEQQELEVLAGNIELIGLINPIILNQKKGNKNLILIAGERRTRAYNILFKHWGKQFSKIPANIYRNLTEEQHYMIQASENSYVPVPSAEAAESYAHQYAFQKERYEKTGKHLSKALFARSVGRHESTILDALKFADLEKEIREWTHKKLLPYGAAVQIARIEDHAARMTLASIAMTKNYNEERTKQMVNSRLLEQNGQSTFFNSTEDKALSRTVLDVLGEGVCNAAIQSAEYMKRIRQIIDLKPEFNPLGKESIINRLEKINQYSALLLKHKKRNPEQDLDEEKSKIPRIEIVYPK